MTAQDSVDPEDTEAGARFLVDPRPVDPTLAAAAITRATEALDYGMARDEPDWLHHSDFAQEGH